MKRLSLFLLLSLILSTLVGCGGGEKGIVIDDAWVRPSPMMAGNGAGYMVIKNFGDEDDALISADADISETVELHKTTIGEGDMMNMEPVSAIEVPADGNAKLEPGGYHIMFINLHSQLEVGQTVTITLTFKKAGEIQVDAEVRAE